MRLGVTSNGEVERAVKTTKSLLKKEKDPTKGLLTYRSTLLACGHLPAEPLIGGKIRTTVPTFHTNLAPNWPDIDKLRQNEAESKDKLRTNLNHRHRPVPLEPLQPGTQVYINDGNTAGTVTGTVASAEETPRSYTVETGRGTVRRNRSHITPVPGDKPEMPSSKKPVSVDKPPTPVKSLPSSCISSRQKRLTKPSLKLKERLGHA